MKNAGKPVLRVVPLGGLGEVGKNMLVLETEDDAIVIDAGVMFPEVDMPGIELVIPNTDYIAARSDKVRAILVTHGHEDHIGALPYLLPHLKAPIYAPAMATELIRNRLKEHRLLDKTEINVIKSGERVKVGGLEAEWFEVNHSIPDAMGIAVRTPLGLVIHTGDFKLDNDPVLGNPTDFTHINNLAKEGVFLLLSDSTYAETEGYSDSDRLVVESLFRHIGEAQGRIFVASFASQIARIQIVADAARVNGRKLVLVGRSMLNNLRIARELGHLDIPQEMLITPAEARGIPDNKIAFMLTGSQGEQRSALVRIAHGEHREIDIRHGDTVIISASPIPGNEVSVNAAVDNLARKGALVFYKRSDRVHVHGHAMREELRIMLNITQPRFFVPVHGEYRMLKAHADLAVDQGTQEDRTFVLSDGDILELNSEFGKVVDRTPAGHVFVNGLSLWRESGNVLNERLSLAKDGVVVIALTRNQSGWNGGTPHIKSSGFVQTEDAPALFRDAISEIKNVLDQHKHNNLEWNGVERLVNNTVRKFLVRRTKRHPLIITFSIDV